MNKACLLPMALAVIFAREIPAQEVVPTVIYTREHDLFVKTIRNGRAQGVMTGETAEKYRKQFRSDGILLVTAQAIQDFEGQPDCKRIRVVYTKKEIITPAGPRDLEMQIKLNYCLSGQAPIGGENVND